MEQIKLGNRDMIEINKAAIEPEMIQVSLRNLVEIKKFGGEYVEILLTSENQVRWVKIRPESFEEIKKVLPAIKEEDVPEGQGVYLLTCLIEEGKSYNGEGVNLRKRIAQHRRSEYNNAKDEVITRAIRKYGWENFEIRLLEVFTEEEKTKFEVLDLEEAYIKHYDLLNKEIGYNVLPRGTDRTGYKASEETKQKQSKAMSGINHPFFGKKLSLEHCNNISKSHIGEKNPLFGKPGFMLGRKHSQETREKISKATNGENNPNFGKICSERTKEKISKSKLGNTCSVKTKYKLSKAMSGENNPMFGKVHSKETRLKQSNSRLGKKNSQDTIAKIVAKRKKVINQLDLNTGDIINTWSSILEASKNLVINRAGIGEVCRGNRKSAGGFSWAFVNNPIN